MKVKEISKSDIKQKEIDKLHPDFGLIKKESIIKKRYYRSDEGKLWELTILK